MKDDEVCLGCWEESWRHHGYDPSHPIACGKVSFWCTAGGQVSRHKTCNGIACSCSCHTGVTDELALETVLGLQRIMEETA